MGRWRGRQTAAPEPLSPEEGRIKQARQVVETSCTDASMLSTFAELESVVRSVIADRDRLNAQLATMDPERTANELKAALRSRMDPTAPDTPAVQALRRRYEAVNRAFSRRDELNDLITALLIEAETTAAEAAAGYLAGDSAALVRTAVGRLRGDLDALVAARAEIDDLGKM
ncbi:MAG: hypothetical protein KAZ88_05095 [Acidimicrobiia bacterium]|nr:hypothetical protein [Acidimicrobiia bacterium]